MNRVPRRARPSADDEPSEVHVGDLVPDPDNARAHNLRGHTEVARSLETVGAARPIVVDRDLKVLAGNKTVEAAAEVGIERVLVVPAARDELVAVRRRDLDPRGKAALKVMDNRAGEHSAWFRGQLEAVAERHGLDLTELGFRADDAIRYVTPGAAWPPNVDPATIPGYDPTTDRYEVRIEGVPLADRDAIRARVAEALEGTGYALAP